MTREKKNNALERLAFEQVASLCCVSESKVKKWVKERGLPTITINPEQVYCNDLVDFLVQYNMPIPTSILPIKAKKILFVFSRETLGYIYITFLEKFFQKLRIEENFISDTVCYEQKVRYKILTFSPDLIVIDTIETFNKSLQLIKFAKNTSGCPILSIVGNHLSTDKAIQINAAGADAVVARSVNMEVLIEKIHSLFK